MADKQPDKATRIRDTRLLARLGSPQLKGMQLPKWASTRWAALAITAAGIILLFPYTFAVQTFDLLKEGEVARETVIAPLTFDVLKSADELNEDRRAAMEKILLVANYDPEVLKRVRERFRDLRIQLKTLSDPKAPDSLKSRARALLEKDLSTATVSILAGKPALATEAAAIAEQLLSRGVLSILLVPSSQRLDELRTSYHAPFDHHMIYTKGYISLRRDSVETTVLCSDLPTREIALEDALQRLRNRRKFDESALNSIYEILDAYVQPNVNIDDAETARRRQRASDEVLSIKGKVIRETEIVRKHQEVTAEIAQKLRSLRAAIMALDSSGERQRIVAANVGALLLALLLLLMLGYYVQRFHAAVAANPMHTLALAAILVFQVAIIRFGMLLTQRLFESGGEVTPFMPVLIVPGIAASILVTILFGLELSFAVTLFVAGFVGLVQGFSYAVFLYTLMGGFVAGFSTRAIRYRWDFFRAIPPIVAVYALFVFLLQLTTHKLALVPLIQNLGLAAGNAVVATVLAMMAVAIFENFFDLTTNMKLVELADMNHPVLKRLSIEAAGTYNHSVLVGNLAESAAERIGANALLARVASYYHDIGKLSKVEYFIENCTNAERNKHAKLSPSMSALIISSHVKEGVEIARASKLPKVIQDAILQHHGTSTVSFFYEKALEQDPHNQVQEEDYRYPGPRPQTRENAIIMLADSVEAASRSLATSSPKLLRELVKKIIRDKFTSSQLDQCDLTLRDLDEIVEGFMPVLQGIFHTRIEYPNK